MDEGVKMKQERKSKVKDEPDVKPGKGETSRKVRVEKVVEKAVRTKTEPGVTLKQETSVTKVKAIVEKRERKVFELPGQKHEPLEERDGLRVFYESLYSQRPDSEMAQIWMMEYGMLEREEAQGVLDRVRMKKSGLVNYSSSSRGGAASSRGASNGAKKTPPSKAREPEVKNPRAEKTKAASNGKAAPKNKRKEYDDDEEDDSEGEVIPQKKVRGAY